MNWFLLIYLSSIFLTGVIIFITLSKCDHKWEYITTRIRSHSIKDYEIDKYKVYECEHCKKIKKTSDF